VHRQGLEPRTR